MSFTDAFGAVAGTIIGGLLMNQGGVRFMLVGGVLIAFEGTVLTIVAAVRGKTKR